MLLRTEFFCLCDSVCVCVRVINLAFQVRCPEDAKICNDFLSPAADTSIGTSVGPHAVRVVAATILPRRDGTKLLPPSPAFSRENNTN